jgi:uncharacterized FlaG/YvyC family protein
MEMWKTSSIDLSFKIKQNTVLAEPPKPQHTDTAAKASKQPKADPMPDIKMATGNKAVFKLLDNKQTVIQFIDEKGNVVKQTPPKEVIAAAEHIQEIIEHLVDREA